MDRRSRQALPRVAPAYANRHSLTINGKNEGISRHDLETVGRNNDIQDYSSLIDQVEQAIKNFEHFALEAGVDKSLIKIIQADFMKVG